MRIAVIILISLSMCAGSFADDNTCMSNDLIVTAIDEYGAFVRNLGPANFKAEVHGHPLPILSSAFQRHD
jgi:hypothetical protein